MSAPGLLRPAPTSTDTSSLTPAVVQTSQTDEFGIPLLTQGNVEQPFSFTGEQRDAETGFIYLRARMYDPSLGRFLQRDPFPGFLAAPLSLHRFAYVQNNPSTAVDPSGLASVILKDYHAWDDECSQAVGEPFFAPLARVSNPTCLEWVWNARVGFPVASPFGGPPGLQWGAAPLADAPGHRDTASDGMPGDHERANKQFKDAVREAERRLGRKLTRRELQQAHWEVSGQGYSYEELVNAILDLFS